MDLSKLEVVLGLVTLLLGGLGAKDIISRYTKTNNEKIKELVEINKAKEETDSFTIKAMKEIVTTTIEVNGELRGQIGSLMQRVDRLEERERHSLTRAAVHEAWDQMSFELLVRLDPLHPPPPPLRLPEVDEEMITEKRHNEEN